MNLQEITTALRELSQKVETLWKGSKHGKAKKAPPAAPAGQDGPPERAVPEKAQP